MPINVKCPRGHMIAVAEKYAGKRVKCPKCETAVVVPGANGSAKAAEQGTVQSKPNNTDQTVKPPPLPKPTGGNLDIPPMPVPPVALTPSALPPIVASQA